MWMCVCVCMFKGVFNERSGLPTNSTAVLTYKDKVGADTEYNLTVLEHTNRQRPFDHALLL